MASVANVKSAGIAADPESLLAEMVTLAKKKGAEAADAVLVDAASLAVACRLGHIETLERAESGDLGLRVLIGKKQAIVSSTNRKPAALEELVERAIAMARAAPEDEFCGLAAPDEIAHQWPVLDIADSHEPSAEQLIAAAREAEDAARAVKGVSNSEGADASYGASHIAFVASNGFAGRYRRTSFGLGASMIAGDGTNMERDYHGEGRVFAADLPQPAAIGREAGERTVKRLGSRKMPTAQVPVVFEPRVAGGMLGHLSGAISGASIARGTSFLKDKLGQKIFPGNITIIDDPFRTRGFRSHPFDGEGLLPQRRKIVENGVLTTWLLDLRSARQLKLTSTGHASRGAGGLPSPAPSNFYLEAGTKTSSELINDIKSGFYVTELMGYGVNGVTGDYSRAAAGFWIENGAITFPVNEMTIAGNLKDMFLNLSAADDLQFLHGLDAPTIRIDGMTVAGV
ncbi:MAG TPA: TldD/PmbA family protein [Alphaproteobacteria bacterium]|nr:TldD/PmbA family protein [Alphaproteobacteria bacterium]